MKPGAERDSMICGPRACGVDAGDKGPHPVAGAQVFLRDHLAALQAAFHPAALDDDVALVQPLDGADEDLVAARQEVIEQGLALGVADLLQDHLLGGHGADAPDRHRGHRLLDVVTHLDLGDAVQRIRQHLFGIGVLQAGFVRHHQPAAEGFIVAGVAVDRHADVDLAAMQLLGGLRQRGLDRAEHHIPVHALLARDGVHQHQHFAVHQS
jgi:hypothetical protein